MILTIIVAVTINTNISIILLKEWLVCAFHTFCMNSAVDIHLINLKLLSKNTLKPCIGVIWVRRVNMLKRKNPGGGTDCGAAGDEEPAV